MQRDYLVTGKHLPEGLAEGAEKLIRELRGVSVERVPIGSPPQTEETSTLFLLIDDAEYRQNILDYVDRPVRLVFLPWRGNPLLQKEWRVPESIEEAIALADEDAETMTLHALTLCNGTPLLGEAILGETEWPRKRPPVSRLLSLLRHAGRLRFHPYRIETAKGQSVETAALVIRTGREQSDDRYVAGEEHLCERVSAVVCAPPGLLALLRQQVPYPRRKRSLLPEGVGTLKSRRLSFFASEGPVPLSCNGFREYVIRTTIESRNIRAGILLPIASCGRGDPDKESLRIRNLPLEREIIDYYTHRRLPLVPVASESLFAELFTALREGARIHRAYLLLLIVSVLMATTGLFQDSAPTLIGAMILAPLMAPIISLTMGLLRFDGSLGVPAARTLGLSVLIVLGTAAALTLLLPFTHLTGQMAARTHPTLLDLAVAMLSGVAAAYGYTNAKVGQSLAGVAIAVALVPPLCVAGIGLGWSEFALFWPAFLLFVTNFVGILFAAGATFYLLGFSSPRHTTAAFALKIILLAAVALSLGYPTRQLLQEEALHRTFDALKQIRIDGKEVSIRLRRIERTSRGMEADLLILLPEGVDEAAGRRIVRILRERVESDVRLSVSFRHLY